MAQVNPDALFPKAQSRPFVVRDAFEELIDDPIERVVPKADSITLEQMTQVRSGERCKLHHSHHRLTFSKPAPTVDRGGGSGEWHIWHPAENRPITRKEVKRLASFPDSFSFAGNVSDAFTQIGNSVPPLFMRAIAKQITRVMFGGSELTPYPKGMKYLDILDAAWADHLAERIPDAPTVISLFSGCGGSSLGYSMAGYRELLAVEWDANAVATFKLNFPGVPVYHGDIAKLTVDECLKLANLPGPRQLDVLDGSPPCQGFSMAGKREMDDDRNQLFREFVRLLRGLQPQVFVMENVSGMVKGKMKLIFVDILRELKASGYKVSARLLNAMYFDVPQSRERMIFIGVRDDLEIAPSHPQAMSNEISVASVLGVSGHIAYRHNYSVGNVNWAISDFTKPCLTITKTGLGWKCFIDGVHRNFTRTELQMLASYPGAFKFLNDESAWARIGNSVPPLLMRAIAQHVKQKLELVTHD